MIGGPQGSGIDTSANIFGRGFGYGGYHLYGKREYHSNVKGLHSYFHFRVSNKPVAANVNDVNLLAAFDAETIVRHIREVTPKGGIIIDKSDLNLAISEIRTLPSELMKLIMKNHGSKRTHKTIIDLIEEAKEKETRVYVVPFLDLLKEVGDEFGIEKLSRVTRMKNILALGTTFGLLNYDASLVEKAIGVVFREKPGVVKMNVSAFNKAYEYSKQNFDDDFPHKFKKLDIHEERIFLLGNQAVALGKVLGGCRIQTYYPITPAADESEFLEAHEVFKLQSGNGAILVIQTEDEIAAVNMASGAALAGARASTTTSGPGFSLMVEGLSWAGNNEVPIVITYYQRGAPSTGLPTRHGQDDLRFVIHSGHGEFPRIVLASGDMKECFFDAARAFNYAEKYQMPVIHLIDKAMANSTQSYKVFDLSQVKIDRGEIASRDDLQIGKYKRFRFTDSGISPRAFLGTKGALMWYTGDEHDEIGHISEEPLNRNQMMEKRMKKLVKAGEEIPSEEKFNFFGQEETKNIIISWGSTKGAILEAMELLRKEGFNLAFLQIRMIQPLPSNSIERILGQAEMKIAIEMNYSGQLAATITEKTGIFMDYFILKYNGRPMTTTEVYEALKKILRKNAEKRQVLIHGS
ncbi:MAG: 2-oxoacid:acceptor oxidoreductase subunit alpha [Candidatus Bathyarchaeota archaeon]|nr:MAG: 2-oxoacid:acceptor oxidoreductase subunit alpha [Candidatus Bathyarchaeota archaeon]